MTTWDDWASQIADSGLDLIKLDVEGHALAALEGSARLLARCRPLIVCEAHRRDDVSYSPKELVSWLQQAGYGISLIPTLQDPGELLHEAMTQLEAAKPPGWQRLANSKGSRRLMYDSGC